MDAPVWLLPVHLSASKHEALFILSCGDYSNSLLTSISSLMHHFQNLIFLIWWNQPANPMISGWDSHELCSAKQEDNLTQSGFQSTFQLYYVWNNCVFAPPYGVAVVTDEHLTAVGQGCHANTASLHLCACLCVCVCVCVVGTFFPSFFAVWVMCRASWEWGAGAILTPGRTSPSPVKGLPPTGMRFKPVKAQRARWVNPVLRLFSRHLPYQQSGRVPAGPPSLARDGAKYQFIIHVTTLPWIISPDCFHILSEMREELLPTGSWYFTCDRSFVWNFKDVNQINRLTLLNYSFS